MKVFHDLGIFGDNLEGVFTPRGQWIDVLHYERISDNESFRDFVHRWSPLVKKAHEDRTLPANHEILSYYLFVCNVYIKRPSSEDGKCLWYSTSYKEGVRPPRCNATVKGRQCKKTSRPGTGKCASHWSYSKEEAHRFGIKINRY